MSKQQFKSQADICKKSLDILHKAIELDPGNAEEYQVGIAYTEGVMKASNAIVLVTDNAMRPVACLELANKGKKKGRQIFDLVQAKLFANEKLKKNTQINSTVMQWANQLKIEPHTIDVDATVV